MKEELIAFLAAKSGVSEEKLRDSEDDAELWSSFQRIQLVLEIEQTYGLMFSKEELEGLKSPRSFIDTITAKSQKT